jgi:hypothetical protein
MKEWVAGMSDTYIHRPAHTDTNRERERERVVVFRILFPIQYNILSSVLLHVYITTPHEHFIVHFRPLMYSIPVVRKRRFVLIVAAPHNDGRMAAQTADLILDLFRDGI